MIPSDQQKKGNIPPRAKEVKTNNRPQNKDDLDSREGEEQIIKGGDITHNKKDKRSEGEK